MCVAECGPGAQGTRVSRVFGEVSAEHGVGWGGGEQQEATPDWQGLGAADREAQTRTLRGVWERAFGERRLLEAALCGRDRGGCARSRKPGLF